MKRYWIGMLCLGWLGVGRVEAAETLLLQHGEQYFRLRDEVSPITTPDIAQLRKSPESFRGKAVELRGVVFALGGADGRATFTLCQEPSTLPAEVVLPDGATHASIPELTIGNAVRVLCRVEADPIWKEGRLVLADVVNEPEAAFTESARGYLKRVHEHPEASASPVKAGAAPPKEPLDRLYAEAIQHFRPDIDEGLAHKIAGWILKYSKAYVVDSRLVMAMVAQESAFSPSARSNRGALGLGQLEPATAKELGVDPSDPEQNIKGAVMYLKRNLNGQTTRDRSYIEAVKRTLACYNAGAGKVHKFNGVPPYPETQAYVRKITRWYHQMLTDYEKKLWQP